MRREQKILIKQAVNIAEKYCRFQRDKVVFGGDGVPTLV